MSVTCYYICQWGHNVIHLNTIQNILSTFSHASSALTTERTTDPTSRQSISNVFMKRWFDVKTWLNFNTKTLVWISDHTWIETLSQEYRNAGSWIHETKPVWQIIMIDLSWLQLTRSLKYTYTAIQLSNKRVNYLDGGEWHVTSKETALRTVHPTAPHWHLNLLKKSLKKNGA